MSGLDRVTQEVLLRGTLFNGLYRLSLPSEHKALLGEILLSSRMLVSLFYLVMNVKESVISVSVKKCL